MGLLCEEETMKRSIVIGNAIAILLLLLLCGCTDAPATSNLTENEDVTTLGRELPPAQPGSDAFAIDQNLNMGTIDDYLGLPGVEYTDMRMIHDPADYAAIGGDPDLSFTISGFKVVPFPYIGTLQELPVDGAYAGDRLFDIQWDENGQIVSAIPRYEESMQILEELFPKDKANVIMCGGAGYAHMMTELLKYLGWDAERIYNIGGAWDYTGYHAEELVRVESDGNVHYYTWRANIPDIDFKYLHPVG